MKDKRWIIVLLGVVLGKFVADFNSYEKNKKTKERVSYTKMPEGDPIVIPQPKHPSEIVVVKEEAKVVVEAQEHTKETSHEGDMYPFSLTLTCEGDVRSIHIEGFQYGNEIQKEVLGLQINSHTSDYYYSNQGLVLHDMIVNNNTPDNIILHSIGLIGKLKKASVDIYIDYNIYINNMGYECEKEFILKNKLAMRPLTFEEYEQLQTSIKDIKEMQEKRANKTKKRKERENNEEFDEASN